MSQYEPLIPKYPPASIPEIVAHIQKYLALNGVVPGVASVCGVMPNNDHNIPLKGSDIPLQSMSVQTIAQAIEALSTTISNLTDLIVALGPIANLTSESDTAALAASQGKVLNDQIEALGPIANLTSESDTAALAASQGKVLNDKISHYLKVELVLGGTTKTLVSIDVGRPGPTGILIIAYNALYLISQVSSADELTSNSFLDPAGSEISLNNRSITFGSDTNRSYWVLLPPGFSLT